MKIFALCLLLFTSAGYAADKTEYKSESRDVNVRVYPLSLFIGRLSGDIDVKIAREWTIGPTLSYGNAGFLGTNLNYSSYGVRVNFYLNGAAISDGWLVGGMAERVEARAESDGLKAETSGTAVTGLAAYNVMYDTFNMTFGGGYTFSNAEAVEKKEETATTRREVKVSAKPSGLYLEFTVGLAF